MYQFQDSMVLFGGLILHFRIFEGFPIYHQALLVNMEQSSLGVGHEFYDTHHIVP